MSTLLRFAGGMDQIAPQPPFACDAQLWARFLTACRMRDQTPAAVLRDLIRQEVQRNDRRSAKDGEVADEQLLWRLRHLVAGALIGARDWAGLQTALARHGLAYHPAGGGLTLIDTETGEILCKASQAGPAYLALVRRFGTGFPGHPRPGIAHLALDRAAQPNPSAIST